VTPPQKKAPPKKKVGQATGPRRFDGKLRDIPSQARWEGVTDKAVRSRVARGLIPYRRLGGRIVFLADEVDAFLRQLPGVTAEQALENCVRRAGGEP
jgi:hypothetical protein